MRIYFGHNRKGLYVGVALGSYGHRARHVTHLDGSRTALRPVTAGAVALLVLGLIVLASLYFPVKTQ